MIANPHAEGAILHAGSALQEAKLAVILLHGRGGSAEDILGLAAAFRLSGVAYLAPQAAGHTWYPQSFLAPRSVNEPYLTSALAKVGAVVRLAEEAGLREDQIIVAGFSQGACLATEFAATHPATLGGLIAFTGGLIGPPGTDFRSLGHAAPNWLKGMEALFLSGDPDPHVPWERVQESADVLSAMGASVVARRFPGRSHTVTQAEVELAHALLTRRLERAATS